MNLTSPAEIKRLLEQHNIAPHKALGQHFLIDANALNGILAAAQIEPADTVLEIGPGLGALTRELVKRAVCVVAVEVDAGFARFLSETLEAENLILIHDDFLKANLDIERLRSPFKLVANLPYNITTPIMMRVLRSGMPWRSMTLLVQSEVAQRLRAEPSTKAYGSLSVQAQLRADVSVALRVPPGCFFPPPKVDSSVVTLTRKELPEGLDEAAFDRLVRGGFAMRRKTLANNLAQGVCGSREAAERLLGKAGLPEKIRAEALSVGDFVRLAQEMTIVNQL